MATHDTKTLLAGELEAGVAIESSTQTPVCAMVTLETFARVRAGAHTPA